MVTTTSCCSSGASGCAWFHASRRWPSSSACAATGETRATSGPLPQGRMGAWRSTPVWISQLLADVTTRPGTLRALPPRQFAGDSRRRGPRQAQRARRELAVEGQVHRGGQQRAGRDFAWAHQLRHREVLHGGRRALRQLHGGDGAVGGAEIDADDVLHGRSGHCGSSLNWDFPPRGVLPFTPRGPSVHPERSRGASRAVSPPDGR